MKFYRVGTGRSITRDHIPAYVLSETPTVTCWTIEDLQCLTLTSENGLWVVTQNRKIPVRSGYHLISALRFTDPQIQLTILGTKDVSDVMGYVQANQDKQDPKFKDNIDSVVDYVFRSIIMHNFNSCSKTLRYLGLQNIRIIYHPISENKSIGVASNNRDMQLFEGNNKFGVTLTKLAKEFAKDSSTFLSVDSLTDFTLLGSPIRSIRRTDLSDDTKFQPRERVLVSLGMVAAASKSKTEQYLES